MSFSRKHHNAGIRCPGHDYTSKCIYHIVLNKSPGIPDFSSVEGYVGNHQWPPCVRHTELGKIIGTALSSLKNAFPFTSIPRRCIMPDHVHFVLYVHEQTDIHLGDLIKHIKNECRRSWKESGHDSSEKIFVKNYHDTFLTGKNQLSRMLSYVSDNPRRHLLRKEHPGWFRRFHISDGRVTYEAYGNWDLLDEPCIEPVKISSKYTQEELIRRKRLWLQTVRNDGILVSPFISKAEKKVREWACDNGGVLIYITTDSFPERFKPDGVLLDLCAEGRLMLVSVPDCLSHAPDEPYDFRNHCLMMNDLADRIANHHFHRI